MKSSTLLKSQKGFSLVELMIVVAIIGILAAIGIPQYAKFQARARQSEAKGSLSSLYTSEQSFHGEWTVYSTDLPDIGFAVTGVNLRYITGFDAAVTCGGAWPGNAPVEDGAKDTATLASTGVTFANGITLTNFPLTGSACANPAGGATGTSTFTGAASGTPRNSIESTVDRWTINNNKVVTNTANGL